MRRGLWLATFVLALFAFVTPAAAGPLTIDFSTGLAGVGGTIVSAGGVVTGTAIPIGALTVEGTAARDGVYIANAVLNFGYGVPVAGGAPVNFINIVGSIPTLQVSGPLLTGTFTSFEFVPGLGMRGSGPDQKYPALLEALGVPLNVVFSFYGFSILVGQGTDEVISTDIRNTVPDAGSSLLLMGLGLVGLRMWRKR